MKILQVISKFYLSGAESLVYNMAPLMNNSNNSVVILALYNNENSVEEKSIIDSLNKLGIKTHILGTREMKLKLLLKFRKYISENQFDIIHSHAFQPNIYSRFSVAFKKIPVVVTFHSASNDWNTQKARIIETLADNFTAARVSVSNVPINFYRAKISRNKEIIKIPNGIPLVKTVLSDEKIKKIRKKLGIPDDGVFLLNVGRIVEQKGHVYLIDALIDLKEKNHTNIYVYIAGELQNKYITNELRKKIEENDLEKNVVLLGSRKDIKDLLVAADIFVFPSIAEAHPIALIEAAYFSKPIIATSIEANINTLEKESAFFVEPRNAIELSNEILRVIENEDLTKIKSINANNEVKEKYDIKTTASKYLELFERIH